MARFYRITGSLVLMLLPLLVGSALLYISRRVTIFDIHIYSTGVWNDQMSYWLQVRTFAAAGFGGGYYTANEVPAPVDFIHFFSWGPLIPTVYGSIARIIGWEMWTPLVLHSVWMALATTAFLQIVKPDLRRSLAFAFLLAAFPPLVLFFPTLMAEVINYAVAIALAAGFYGLLKSEQKRGSLIYLLLMLTLAGLLRTTWMILVVPLATYLALSKKNLAHGALGALIGSFVFLSFYIITQQVAAPFPNVASFIFTRLATDFAEGLALARLNFTINLSELLMPAYNLETLLMWQVYLVIIDATLNFISTVSRKGKAAIGDDDAMLSLLHIFNLVVIILIVLLLYSTSSLRLYRVLAPHLLLSVVLMIATRRTAPVVLIFVLMLASLYPLIAAHSEIVDRNFFESAWTDEEVVAIRTIYEEHGIQYDGTATNAWCNTMIMNIDVYAHAEYLVALDDGIGVGIVLIEFLDEPLPFRSHYIFLTDEHSQNFPFLSDFDLLQTIEGVGAIYHNPNTECP